MSTKDPRPSREEWERIEPVLDRAFELDPSEWPALLDRECGDDDALRRRIEAYLQADAKGMSMLEAGAAPWLADVVDDPSTAGRIPDYRLIDQVGRGGMSVVFRAERADGYFDKQVAVKVVSRGGSLGDELAERFRVEARVLASLEHPNIAHVLDAGTTDRGDPYLVMELVDGRPITDYCADERLPIRRRLELFQQVVRAVHHAHQRLVVHRDLKPSNILVARPPAGSAAPGQVKLLDFGIAKLLDDPMDDRTRTGLFLMTPQYAAPEQVRGEEITTATDVYALGLLLYEILVGEPPYRVEGRAPRDIVDTICGTEPARPSTRITGDSGGHHPDESVAVIRSRLRGDLDAIVLKALEKDPSRRYASALSLLDDLNNYLEGRPIEAKGAGRLYRASKFVGRHRVMVAGLSLLFVLVAGAGVRERLNANRIATERDRADQLVTFLVEMFQDTDPAATRGREVTADELLARAVERVETDLDGQPLEQARLWSTIGEIYNNLGLLEDALPLLERSLGIYVETYGPEHPDVYTARILVGNTQFVLGDLDGSEASMRLAYDGARRTLGPDHDRTLDAATGLSTALHGLGELDESRALMEETIPALTRRHGPDHVSTLAAQLALANVLHSAGEWEAAEEAYRIAVDGRRRTLGDDHPDTMFAINDLALLLKDVGRSEEAVASMRRLVVDAQRVFGEDHHEALNLKNSLGTTLYSLGEYEESAQVLTEVYEASERTLGPDHPGTLNSLNNAAMLQLRLEDFDRAHAMMLKAREGYARTLGPKHPQTLTMMHNLGNVERQRGRVDDAITLLRETRALRQEVHGADHLFTLLTEAVLGQCYVDRGDLTDARDLLTGTVERAEASAPSGHWVIGNASLHLGRSLLRLGELEQAEAALLGAWENREDGSARARAEVAEELVTLYEELGRAEDAARFTATLNASDS